MLYSVSMEMERNGFEEEAILVWNELAVHDPLHPLAQQAVLKIARTYGREPEAAPEGGRGLPGTELHPRRQRPEPCSRPSSASATR